MSSDIHIYLWNYHHNPGHNYIRHLQKFHALQSQKFKCVCQELTGLLGTVHNHQILKR